MNAIRENLTKTKFPNIILIKKGQLHLQIGLFFMPLLPKIQLNSHDKSIYDYQIRNFSIKLH